MASNIRFRGSCVALVTPFTNDAAQLVDLGLVEKLVQMHADAGTSCIVPCGTTGETPTLSDAEWESVVALVTQNAKSAGMSVMAGTGSNSTKKAVQLTERAAKLGVDGCLIVTPYYNKPTPDGLLQHFRELNAVGVPLVLYNVPGRTGIDVSADTFIRIWEECPNIVGLKAANGNIDDMTEIVYRTADSTRPLALLSGDDSLTLPILSIGGAGVISVVANVAPKAMSELIAAWDRGDALTARKYMHALHKFSWSLLKLGSNPSVVKAAMRQAKIEVGLPRLPLVDISEEAKAKLVGLARSMRAAFERDKLEYDAVLNNIG